MCKTSVRYHPRDVPLIGRSNHPFIGERVQTMKGELILEKDLAEMTVPNLLQRLKDLDDLSDGGHDPNEVVVSDHDATSDDSESDDPVSADDLATDPTNVEGLHQTMLRRSQRLEQTQARVGPLQQALRAFQKGLSGPNRPTADDVDVEDTEDENYRPRRRQVRQVHITEPLWRRQPEIVRLYKRRVQRIDRLKDRAERLDRQVQAARTQWQDALRIRQRLERREQYRREQRSRGAKEQERRWLEEFRQRARAKRQAEEEQERKAARQRREREETRRSREEQQLKEEKRRKLAHQVARFQQHDKLLADRIENRKLWANFSQIIEQGGDPRASNPVSIQAATVMEAVHKNRDRDIENELARLALPLSPQRRSGPSVQKYRRDDYLPEEGDLEYHFRGA